MLDEIGGIQSGLMALFGLFLVPFAKFNFHLVAINKLYKVKSKSLYSSQHIVNDNLKLNSIDKLHMCIPCKKSKLRDIYNQGKDKLRFDMSVERLVQQI